MKSSNLRHCQACSQNKGLSEYQRRAKSCRLAHPPPEAERQVGDKERGRAGKGQSRPFHSFTHTFSHSHIYIYEHTESYKLAGIQPIYPSQYKSFISAFVSEMKLD